MTAAAASARFGTLGAIVGLLAIACAVLPFWVLPAVFPAKPAERAVVDMTHRLKDRIAGKPQPQASAERSELDRWYELCSIAAVALGVAAIALAVVSFLRQEPWRYPGTAAALGAAAIVAQYALFALMLVVTLIIVFAILDRIGFF